MALSKHSLLHEKINKIAFLHNRMRFFQQKSPRGLNAFPTGCVASTHGPEWGYFSLGNP